MTFIRENVLFLLGECESKHNDTTWYLVKTFHVSSTVYSFLRILFCNTLFCISEMPRG